MQIKLKCAEEESRIIGIQLIGVRGGKSLILVEILISDFLT